MARIVQISVRRIPLRVQTIMAIQSTPLAFTVFTSLMVAGALIVGVAQQKTESFNPAANSQPDAQDSASTAESNREQDSTSNRMFQPISTEPAPVEIRRFDAYKDPLIPPDPNKSFDLTFHREFGPSRISSSAAITLNQFA